MTRDFVHLLSDRRLTDLRTHRPDIESNATKSVLFHSSLVLGFTGPAELPSVSGVFVPTNEWIVNAIAECENTGRALRRILDTLNEIFPRLHPSIPLEVLRLDIAFVGWGLAEDGEIQPIRGVISNEASADHRSFVGSLEFVPVDDRIVAIMTYGVRFDAIAMKILNRLFQRMDRLGLGGQWNVVRGLVYAFRRAAERSGAVSQAVLVTSVPKPDPRSHTFAIVGGGPNSAMPTAFFVPEGDGQLSNRVQSFPSAVMPGGIVMDMQVSLGKPPPSSSP